jgi:N-acetylglucosaminyl-diphospho-decaprenol L-rhamnosyltransferase
MKIYDNLTIFFVSYYSKKSISQIIKKINPKIKILIVDNANERGLRKYFNHKFKNVKIISSKFNGGQTGGINIGLKNIKTKYCIYMDSDIDFENSIIKTFYKIANRIKDFIILAPQHEKSKYPEEFFSKKKNIFRNFYLMKIVHGHFLFFNMDNVKKNGLYDEKIFLYFDETDYCLRAYKKGLKIYLIPDIKVNHQGGKSVYLKNKLEIEANKHWHLAWSNFYYHKKNYGYLTAIDKTYHIFLKSIFKFFIYSLFNKRKRVIYFNQCFGLLCSYLGLKSFRRVKL